MIFWAHARVRHPRRPRRRRILELLADDEQSAGAIGAVVQGEFGISQPAVSQHLRVLRESGFATVRPEGARRLYAVEPEALQEVDVWLDRYRQFWNQRLDALDTELARGKRERRARAGRFCRIPDRSERQQGLMSDIDTAVITEPERSIGSA